LLQICEKYIVANLTKNARNRILIVESSKNPGLLNQLDTEVKAMGENLGKLLDEITCLQKTLIICF